MSYVFHKSTVEIIAELGAAQSAGRSIGSTSAVAIFFSISGSDTLSSVLPSCVGRSRPAEVRTPLPGLKPRFVRLFLAATALGRALPLAIGRRITQPANYFLLPSSGPNYRF